MARRRRQRPLLILMLKAPVMGRVKSRLAAEIGFSRAMRFYRANISAVLRNLSRDPRWQTVLAVTPDKELRSPFWPALPLRLPQGGGDLGDRMSRLLSRARAPTVIIGSDIPGIRGSHIAEAFRLAVRHGFVLGPSPDGGFWLVGRGQRPISARQFENVRWSSAHALSDTVRNRTGPTGYAATLPDVDTAADWRNWNAGPGR